MLKKLLKRVILAITFIYVINISLNVVNIFIPFNIFSIAVTSFLGIPGMICLIGISLLL